MLDTAWSELGRHLPIVAIVACLLHAVASLSLKAVSTLLFVTAAIALAILRPRCRRWALRRDISTTPIAPILAVAVVALTGCSSMPPDRWQGQGASAPPRSASSAFAHPETTRAGIALARQSARHPGTSGFRLLSIGIDGFLVRAQMIAAAERTLDIQYFILRSDETGRILSEALLAAADRGVRVRILVDDGETVPGDERIQLLDAHPNVEVRVFNPFRYRGHNRLLRSVEFLFDADRLDYRMHNKLFVVDNAMALVGGRNIGDEYFQVDPDGQFADDDLFVGGPAVDELSATFDAYWSSEGAVPVAALLTGKPSREALDVYRSALRSHAATRLPDGTDYASRIASGKPLDDVLAGRTPLVWARWTVVCDSPDKKKVEKGWRVGALMERPVAEAAMAVESELLMITPYLVPGHEGMVIFGELRRRGAVVRVLTNSLESSTVAPAQAGYMHYRKPLVEAGVDLYEVRALPESSRGTGQSAAMSSHGNYSLHGKMLVFDRRRVFIGSMNFDQRSMHLNTEIGVIVDSPALAAEVAKRFVAMTAPENAYRLSLTDDERRELVWSTSEEGRDVRYDAEPARNVWQKLEVQALTLLPIDKEL